jgi:hypothetical protein
LLHAFPVSNNISVLISKSVKITKFVTAARYCNDLLEPFLNELRDDELTEGYFHQDTATAHSARQTIAYLKNSFTPQ